MQESLHTISPLTTPGDKMKSKQGVIVAVVVIAVVVIAIVFFFRNKKEIAQDGPLTPEQKNAVLADLKNSGVITQPTLTAAQKETILKEQTKAVATTSALTPEEKAEIIKQMNER